MVRLFFALFLLGGVCASVMAQDEAQPATVTENTGKEAVNATGTSGQGADVVKADEGTSGNAAVPVEEQAPTATK